MNVPHGFVSLPLADVIPTKDNPRQIRKDDPAFKEFCANVKALGVLEPVLCRPHPTLKGKYDMRAGARRHAAAVAAGFKEIPAIVKELDDQQALEITVCENLHREDLTPMEESKGVQSLLDGGWEVKAIAAQIGKSPTWVVRRARLTKLSRKLAGMANNPNEALSAWPAAHLELLASLPADIQDVWMKDHAWLNRQDPPDLGHLEEMIGNWTHRLGLAKWALDDAALDPKAGPCTACTKRSSCTPGLFADFDEPAEKVKSKELCLDPQCWGAKRLALVERQKMQIAQEHKIAPILVNGEDAYRTYDCCPGAVELHELTKCSQQTPGAKPCLIASGSDIGKVFWGRPGGQGRGGRTRPVGKDGKPKPRALAERRKELNLRREALVNKALVELVEEEKDEWAKVGLTEEQLFRLVAAFGTIESNATTTYSTGREDWGNYHKSAERKKMLAGLWDQVCPVLVQRLNFFPPLFNVPIREHEELCKLLKIDLAKLRADAVREIPEPKSWAHLKADGSPKTAAPAKAKKPGA
jgi:ParB/RepB/Spo0J family partition protein